MTEPYRNSPTPPPEETQSQQAPGPYPQRPQPPFTDTASPLRNPDAIAAPLPQRLPRNREYLLLALAFITATGVDRLVLAPVLAGTSALRGYAMLWMVWVVAFTTVFWSQCRRKPYSWLAATGILLLCSWLLLSGDGMVYQHNPEYSALCVLSIPALAMMHMQISGEDFDAHSPARTAMHWLAGWFLQPFSAIHELGSPVSAMWNANNADKRHTALRVTGMSLLIGIPVLGVLTALLTSADSIFRQGVQTLLGELDLTSFFVHTLIIVVMTVLCYSLLWNCDIRNITTNSKPPTATAKNAHIPPRTETPGQEKVDTSPHRPFNPTVCTIVLAAVLALYLAFSGVQFTFLFARQGLPDGYTYAEYARQGFWQLLAVTGINLIGYGLVLIYSPRKRTLDGLLLCLIAATAVVLASSAVRLSLYITTYGLTWLRLASLLFMGLVALVLILAIVRLRFADIPMLTVCATLFVFWFVLLGYLNPSAIIDMYNATATVGF
ncbi:DUF4173 domain-containing protein [Bifidobacterium crudilactis]|jgi:hypothetical protein|uniref:DUF4153 domain-containing protein n=1 Tax=Bifidobacterium crudilactis TaxID=327277 RepID=UPI002F35A64B|nr:DUF4173 domain-containing protein [Bifidobacterium crudilactis]